MTKQQTPITPPLKLRPRCLLKKKKKSATSVANKRRGFSSLPDFSQLAVNTNGSSNADLNISKVKLSSPRDESIITLNSCLRHMMLPIRMSSTDRVAPHLESSDQETSSSTSLLPRPPPFSASSVQTLRRALTPSPSPVANNNDSSLFQTPASQVQSRTMVSLTSPPPLRRLKTTQRSIVDLDFDNVPNDILLPSVADLEPSTDDVPDAILLPCI